MQFYQKNPNKFSRIPFKSLLNNNSPPRNLTEKKINKFFKTRQSFSRKKSKKINKSNLKVKFEKSSRKSIKKTKTSSVKKVTKKKINFYETNPSNTFLSLKFNKKKFLTKMKINNNESKKKTIKKNINFAPKKIKTSYILEKKIEKYEKTIERSGLKNKENEEEKKEDKSIDKVKNLFESKTEEEILKNRNVIKIKKEYSNKKTKNSEEFKINKEYILSTLEDNNLENKKFLKELRKTKNQLKDTIMENKYLKIKNSALFKELKAKNEYINKIEINDNIKENNKDLKISLSVEQSKDIINQKKISDLNFLLENEKNKNSELADELFEIQKNNNKFKNEKKKNLKKEKELLLIIDDLKKKMKVIQKENQETMLLLFKNNK